MRRLQYLLRLVDLDNSGDLDYLEFIHLMYLFMERGAYSQIVENSRNPKAVFSGMLFLRHAYVEFDTDGDGRLSRAEMRLFFTDYIGEVRGASGGGASVLFVGGIYHVVRRM